MPNLSRLSSKALMGLGVQSIPIQPPRFSYFRGNTELTTGVTLSRYNTTAELLSTNASRWGRASMTVPNVASAPFPYVSTAIDTLGLADWIFDCWILTSPGTITARAPLHLFSILTADQSQYAGIYAQPNSSFNWGFTVVSKNASPGSSFSGTTTTVPAVGNQWVHFAFVKSNLQVTAYVNGQGTFPTGSHRWSEGYTNIRVGRVEGIATPSGAHYIDNVHLSLGLNRLDINDSSLPNSITVPTSPGNITSNTLWYSLLG